MLYVSLLCIQELFRGSGELLKHMVGIIQPKLVSSDGVFYNYENFVDSLWTIIGKETSSILLKVMMMDIEFHHDCSYDALNVSTLFINKLQFDLYQAITVKHRGSYMSMHLVFDVLNKMRKITHSSEIEANYKMDSIRVIGSIEAANLV